MGLWCVFSMEHVGVLRAPDTSATSCDGECVFSMDSCRVDNPELYYCVYMHESSSCGPRTVSGCSSALFFIPGCCPDLALRCFFLSTVGVANCQIENVIC